MRADNIIILQKLVIIKFSFSNYGRFICTNETNVLIIKKNTFLDGEAHKSGYFNIDYSKMSLSKEINLFLIKY